MFWCCEDGGIGADSVVHDVLTECAVLSLKCSTVSPHVTHVTPLVLPCVSLVSVEVVISVSDGGVHAVRPVSGCVSGTSSRHAVHGAGILELLVAV